MKQPQESHHYHALPHGDAFRYLILESGSAQEPLRCELRTSLLGCAKYEAISYVWGTAPANALVVCNDQDLQINSNLERILRKLRHPEKPRCLWPDSICINQQDADEKGR